MFDFNIGCFGRATETCNGKFHFMLVEFEFSLINFLKFGKFLLF